MGIGIVGEESEKILEKRREIDLVCRNERCGKVSKSKGVSLYSN